MRSRLLFSTLTFAAVGICAQAGTYTFNFNTLSSYADASSIATYMDGVLSAAGCVGCSVTVAGAVADQTYTGEGYVVGPSGNPLTLGNSDGATSNSSTTPSSTHDTFISNTNDSSHQISTEISLIFSGLSVSSASFDYQIFPDGSCPSLGRGNCGGDWWNRSTSVADNPNTPDFTFTTGAASGGTTIFTTYGVAPSASGSDGSSTKNGSSTKYAPQYIGTSGTQNLGGVSELNFVDWPATIGVDNLVITTTSSVPEPSSVLLLATACAGVVLSLRRKFSRQS